MFSRVELMAPVASNTVCFRYRVPGMPDDALNELNIKLQNILTRMGVAVISYTKLKGRTALRACIVNHRSRREDFDFFVGKVKEAGAMMIQKMGES